MRKAIFPTILTLALATVAMAGTTQLNPIADTYTTPEGGCYGSETELLLANYDPAGHYERSMLKFDLTPHTGQQIDSAILHLYRFFGCPAGGVTQTDFFHATEDWDESWSGSHVSHGTTVWANEGFNDNGWWEIDITTLVQAWVSGDFSNYGLVMHAQSGSKWSKFYSREYTESYRPYLVLTGPQVVVQPQSIGKIKALWQ